LWARERIRSAYRRLTPTAGSSWPSVSWSLSSLPMPRSPGSSPGSASTASFPSLCTAFLPAPLSSTGRRILRSSSRPSPQTAMHNSGNTLWRRHEGLLYSFRFGSSSLRRAPAPLRFVRSLRACRFAQPSPACHGRPGRPRRPRRGERFVRFLTPTENKRLNELIGFLCIMLGLLVAAALFTYNPNDASFNVAARPPDGQPAHNLIGPVGAYGSDLLFQ